MVVAHHLRHMDVAQLEEAVDVGIPSTTQGTSISPLENGRLGWLLVCVACVRVCTITLNVRVSGTQVPCLFR